MKVVAYLPYVYRRGGVLWFRRKFPVDVVGKMVNGAPLGAELKMSLKVRTFQEAEGPRLEAMAEWQSTVEAARSSGRKKTAKPFVRDSADPRTLPALPLDQIREGDLVPLLTPWFVRQWGKTPEPVEPGDIEKIANECEIEASAYLNPGDTGATAAIQPLAEVELTRLGFLVDRAHPRFVEAADLMARAKAALLQRDASIIDPSRRAKFRIDDPEVRQLLHAYEARSPRGRGGSRTFGNLLEQFMRDRTTKSLSPGTRREDVVLHRVIRELVGADTRIVDVTPERCMEIRNLFTRLPSNYTKLYPGRLLRDIPDLAERDQRSPMSRKTANKYIEFLGAVFKFGTKRLKWIAENPAEGLRLNIDKTIDTHYLPYSKKELRKLFRGPTFTGCKDAGDGALRPGKTIPNTSVRYWAPLIALYSGMRANEICQLDAADIQLKDGVPVFILSASAEKRLKSRSSRREVPLHPELVRLGLVRLAKDRAGAGAQKLFFDVRPNATGYFSGLFQPWFRRLLRRAKLNRERLSFHSFRGTFKDALIDADVSEPIIEALAGWSSNRSMVRHYGSGPTFKKLCQAVAKADFGPVTAHLKPYGRSRSKGSRAAKPKRTRE